MNKLLLLLYNTIKSSTTNLFLRVLSKRKVSAGRADLSSSELSSEQQANQDIDDMKKVPAYNLPKDQQIDAHYPSYAKAFLSRSLASATLGLSSRVTRDDDSTFSSMESASSGNDILFCPLPFSDMDVFLTLVEEGFANDYTEGGNIRSSYISRWPLPPTPKGKETADALQEADDEVAGSFWAQCGPKRVYLYRDSVRANTDGFTFAKVFPKTHAQLTSGRFRWIKYQKGVLKVNVGRGTGDDNRSAKKSQTLRQWKGPFSSLHDLFCAVEASWAMPGQPSVDLGGTLLPQHDNDLGPSKPLPPDPPVLGQKADAMILSGPNKLARVTALAIVGESGDATTLYSGHEDGSLRRWNLSPANGDSEATPTWSIGACKDWVAVHGSDYGQVRTGVRSIAVRERGSKHLVYTWSHQVEGESIDQSQPDPAEIRVWDGETGRRHHTIVCDIGGPNPLISSVIFTPLLVGGKWLDSLVVGLQATASAYEYDSDFSNYNLHEAQELAEGNIAPFSYRQDVWKIKQNAPSGVVQRGETWRAHGGFIRAMAADDEQHLVASLSEHGGHGFSDEIILWSTEDPGIPLSKVILYTNKRPSRFPLVRDGVSGILLHNGVILVGCGFGDILVPIRVEESSALSLCGSANLKQRYYDDSSFHGHMASGGGEVCAIVNEGETEIWLYSTNLAESQYLDKNTKRKSSREMEDDEDDDRDNKALRARAAALGRVKLTRRAGGSFDQKQLLSSYMSDSNTGGPEVLALKGRHLVAGFGNGAIVAAPLLPNEGPFNTASKGGYGLASSCSTECGGCCEAGLLFHFGEQDEGDYSDGDGYGDEDDYY